MKAYELPTTVTPDGKLELPDFLLGLFSNNQVVRIIALVSESEDVEEQSSIPIGVPGKKLLHFAGAINADDLRIIEKAIEDGCEKVNLNEW